MKNTNPKKVPQKSQKQQKGWRTAYATIIISAISAISAGHIKERFRCFCENKTTFQRDRATLFTYQHISFRSV